jgi:4-alpha-glucanotransferase
VAFSFDPERIDDTALMHEARTAVIQIAYLSCAKYVILPLQDLLGSGADTRMNCPGILSAYNWSWRCRQEMLSDGLAEEIRTAASAGMR